MRYWRRPGAARHSHFIINTLSKALLLCRQNAWQAVFGMKYSYRLMYVFLTFISYK
jgi:hypothetical protein